MSEDKAMVIKENKRAFWARHIQQWKESDLKQEAYCAQEKIGYSSFSKWKSILFPKVQLQKNKSFVPVQINSTQIVQPIQSQSIQIKLTSGHVVSVPATMDLKQVALLIYHLSTPHA